MEILINLLQEKKLGLLSETETEQQKKKDYEFIWHQIKIAEFLLRKCDYQMIVHQKTSKGHLGAILGAVPNEEAKEHIVAIIKEGLASRENFKDFYLAGAEAYLSRYEIDCKDFIKRLDPDYGKER